jgi:16S rRNA (cytosine967-C5)-methyltransferase
MISVQVASASVVGKVLGGKNLDRVLEQEFAARGSMTANERAAVQSIAFDTLRHYGLVSAQLDMLLSAPISDAPVRHLLLVTLTQLQFSKAGAHAIVDHAVSACETMGYARAKALVNAVLRNYLRAPEKFAREKFNEEIARFDFPPWWIERARKEYPAHWETILLSARAHPPMCLRVNRRRTTASEYLAKLASQGLAARALGAAAVLLEKPVPVLALPGFREGLVSVQDVGAQWSAALLAPADGMRVLDACAAPGGKAGHLLEWADIELTAVDSDRLRLKRVQENLDRLGLSATLVMADAADAKKWWDGRLFDRILVDVPCSGSGVVRRHPDIKWIRRQSDIASFARQQSRLLASLWNCLAVGGRLLYATCSIFHAENQEIVARFIDTQKNAAPVPLTPSRAGNDAAPFQHQDGLLFPDDQQDGFFYALLEKTA